MRIAVAWGRHL